MKLLDTLTIPKAKESSNHSAADGRFAPLRLGPVMRKK
jgi:hypothetical protein